MTDTMSENTLQNNVKRIEIINIDTKLQLIEVPSEKTTFHTVYLPCEPHGARKKSKYLDDDAEILRQRELRRERNIRYRKNKKKLKPIVIDKSPDRAKKRRRERDRRYREKNRERLIIMSKFYRDKKNAAKLISTIPEFHSKIGDTHSAEQKNLLKQLHKRLRKEEIKKLKRSDRRHENDSQINHAVPKVSSNVPEVFTIESSSDEISIDEMKIEIPDYPTAPIENENSAFHC